MTQKPKKCKLEDFGELKSCLHDKQHFTQKET